MMIIMTKPTTPKRPYMMYFPNLFMITSSAKSFKTKVVTARPKQVGNTIKNISSASGKESRYNTFPKSSTYHSNY